MCARSHKLNPALHIFSLFSGWTIRSTLRAKYKFRTDSSFHLPIPSPRSLSFSLYLFTLYYPPSLFIPSSTLSSHSLGSFTRLLLIFFSRPSSLASFSPPSPSSVCLPHPHPSLCFGHQVWLRAKMQMLRRTAAVAVCCALVTVVVEDGVSLARVPGSLL